jgi:hypothetical protein
MFHLSQWRLYSSSNDWLDWSNSGSRLSGPIGAETVSTQDGPAGRRLERHTVRLATLIAGDIESLTFASSLWSPKIRTARIPARLAAFRMSQVAFLIVFLFAFCEGKSVSTFCASDLNVWHIADLP